MKVINCFESWYSLIKRLRIYESHIFELRMKTWMKVILAVMCLSSSGNKAWKKFRPVRDLNPWNLRYRSSNIWLSYILNRLFINSRVYLEPTSWPAPSWLVSSVSRSLHRYRRGHRFKSRTGLNFFQALFPLLPK